MAKREELEKCLENEQKKYAKEGKEWDRLLAYYKAQVCNAVVFSAPALFDLTFRCHKMFIRQVVNFFSLIFPLLFSLYESF